MFNAVVATVVVLTATVSPTTASAVDFQIVESRIDVPAGTALNLRRDEIIEVDRFQLLGTLFTDGFGLRIDAGTILIGDAGALRGYSPKIRPATPPQLVANSPAGPGTGVAPPQTSLDMFVNQNQKAGQGQTGSDGRRGETGPAGSEMPGPVVLVSAKLSARGAVILDGQRGGTGGTGQDGQQGGLGGAAQDSSCGSGAVSTYCYPGVVRSGLGGLGGRGGQGGNGGAGGSAIPLLVVTYVDRDVTPTAPPVDAADDADVTPNPCAPASSGSQQFTVANLTSAPGLGGKSGRQGQRGSDGQQGGAGRPCSATADWGAFFGSCSNTGGQRSTEVPTDGRPSVEQCGKAGSAGSEVNWSKYGAEVAVTPAHLTKSVADVQIQGAPIYRQIVSSAVSIELVGRFAVTARDVLTEFAKIPDEKGRTDYAAMIAPQLRETAGAIAMVTGIADLSSTLSSDLSGDLDPQIRITLLAARSEFNSLKSSLLAACSNLKSQGRAAGVNNVDAYLGRALALCAATTLTWLPYERGASSITVRLNPSKIPEDFLPYYSESKSASSAQVETLRIGGSALRMRIGGPRSASRDFASVLLRPEAPLVSYSARFSLSRRSVFPAQDLTELRAEMASALRAK